MYKLKNMKIILLAVAFLAQTYCILFNDNPRSIEFIDMVSYTPPMQVYSITNDLFNNQKANKFEAKVQSDHFIHHKSKSTHPQLIFQQPDKNQIKIQGKDNLTRIQDVKEGSKANGSLQQIKNRTSDNLFLIVFIVAFFSVLILRSRKEPQDNVSIRLPDSETSMSATILPNFETQV